MSPRPLRLYVQKDSAGARMVYLDGQPTGHEVEDDGQGFKLYFVLGVPGQFYRIHEALDALEQDMGIAADD